MKFLFAPDSFKGSLSSQEIIEILTKTAQKYFDPCEIVKVPIADGGEGTLDAILSAVNGKKMKLLVMGPLYEEVEASYGIIDDDTAFIEMAEASGIALIPYKDGNAMDTSTYGTGQLIVKAMEDGYRNIYMAIGGSATNDGGIGAMAALGVRFLDENGEELKPVGRNLIKIRRIDTSKLHPLAAQTTFTVLCDVKNPLIGEKGATYVYGPQKGAVGSYREELEAGMRNYASVVEDQLGTPVADMPGAGAAGGFGAALKVFLNATLQSGIETLFEIVKFDELLQGVDLVITGEGRVDYQSAFGKVLSGIGEHAIKQGIPVIAIAGGMGDGAEELYQHGIDSIMTTVNRIVSLDEAMNRAPEFLENAADRMFRFLSIGYHKLK